MANRRQLAVGSVGIFAGAAVLGIASTATAGVSFFDNQGDFEAAMAAAGKASKAFWDFNPNLLGPGNFGVTGDVTDINNHPGDVWGPGDWNADLDNVGFSSNTTPGGPYTPRAGGNDLVIYNPGFQGSNKNGYVANYFVDGFTILSGANNGYDDTKTGMGLDVTVLPGFGDSFITLSVFDANDDLLGVIEFDLFDVDQNQYIGIQTDGGDTIGRVDIFDNIGGPEGISSISVWQAPAPGALGLLCLAGLAGGRRRRA